MVLDCADGQVVDLGGCAPRVRFRRRWMLSALGRGDRKARVEIAGELLDALEGLEQEFEVVRLVLELALGGMGATAIARELRSGPPWMWRSRRQVRVILDGRVSLGGADGDGRSG